MKLYIDDSLNRWQKSKLMNKLVGKGYGASGVYCITNEINGKKYIGSSCRLRSRLCDHIGKIRNKNHENYDIQIDSFVTPKERFSFEVLEFINNSNTITLLESVHIRQNDTVKNGYNLSYPHRYFKDVDCDVIYPFTHNIIDLIDSDILKAHRSLSINLLSRILRINNSEVRALIEYHHQTRDRILIERGYRFNSLFGRGGCIVRRA